MVKRKSTNNDQQNITQSHKTKDRETRTPLKKGDELKCLGSVDGSRSTSDTRRVTLVTNPVITHEVRRNLGQGFQRGSSFLIEMSYHRKQLFYS